MITPIRVNKEEFKQIFIKSKKTFTSEDSFLTFFFINENTWNPQQMFLYSKELDADIANVSDVAVISNPEGADIALAVIRSEKGQPIRVDDLSHQITSCYLTNE